MYLSAPELRALFNDSGYAERIHQGQLRPIRLRDDHLTNPEAKALPYCTRAQMFRYLDSTGAWVVEAFHYLRPDGTRGASGMYDPKRLRLDAVVYSLPLAPRRPR